MKRLLTTLLLLLLAGLVTMAAAEGNRMLNLQDEEYISRMVSDGETLYIRGDEALYTWKPGEEAPTAWESDVRLPIDADAAPEETNSYGIWELNLYADGDGLHSAVVVNDEEGRGVALWLCDIVFSDHGTIEAANPRLLEVPVEFQDAEYWGINELSGWDGGLVMHCYTEEGDALLIATSERPEKLEAQPLTGWSTQLLPSAQGPILMDYDYGAGEDEAVSLSCILPDGGWEPMCRLPESIQALAIDPVNGALYATLEGRACAVDMQTGEIGAPFAGVPIRPEVATAMDGLYVVNLSSRVAVLDVAGQLAEDQVLSVYCPYYDDWMNGAMVDFAVEHPEITPTLLNAYKPPEDILEEMLTQSPETDIYVLYTHENAYSALRDRGYMLPLTGSEALESLSEQLYPGVREALLWNGELVAVPLMENSFGMGVNTRLLERMGLSVEDIPGDWLGFLDFLEAEIKPRLGELGEGTFTFDDMTAGSFKSILLSEILNGYVCASEAAGKLVDYEAPYFVSLLERLEGMDFTEFGLKEDDGENGIGYGISDDADYLIQFSMPFDFEEQMATGVPLLLGFGDDVPAVLPLDMKLAFVNPFSPHGEEAVAFLEYLAQKLSPQTRYALCPGLNEPVKRPDADKYLAEYEEALANAQAALDNAEAIDRQMLEEDLEYWQRVYERYTTEGIWLISQDRLDWYRANGDRITTTVPSWFEKDTSGEAWELIEQYEAGQLSPREFLAAVNKKARMMAMEG